MLLKCRPLVMSAALVAMGAAATVAHATEGGNDDRATSFEVFPSPAVYTQAYQRYPYRTLGVLCSNFPTHGTSTCCSGSSITSNNKSVVMTSAHCLLNREDEFSEWGSYITFYPQWYEGQQPQGAWPVRFAGPPGRHDGFLFVPPSYQATGEANHDIGFAVMSSQSGQLIADRIGSLGYQFGNITGSADKLHSVIGYPIINGVQRTQQACISPRIASYSHPDGVSLLEVACNRLPPGASGSPSVDRFSGVAGATTDKAMAVLSFTNYNTFNGYGVTRNYLAIMDLNEALPEFYAAQSR